MGHSPAIITRRVKKVTEKYKIVYRGGTGELIQKKSRFIADIRPVKTEEEALSFIEETRKKYWDARHHCYAYIIGDRGQTARFSDDGEPSQTAGKPMMVVLTGAELHDVCVVVTRYFGGTLLGTGGLVRAYSGAVKEGLSTCTVLEKRLAALFEVTASYTDSGKLQYTAAQEGIDILDTQYTDNVAFTFLVPVSEEGRFTARLTEATGGRAQINRAGETWYGMDGKELILL